jgi:regulator of sigma E protease
MDEPRQPNETSEAIQEPELSPETETERKDLLVNLLVLAFLCAAAALFWETLKYPVMFAVTLGVLVFVHEWGHFIAAKAAGVRVYEFALGFGPRLVTYMRRGGTDYTIRVLPLGGFVNLKGMQPDDPVTPDGLNGRRPAERALVYLAGPMMNMVLATLIFCLMGFLFGTPDESIGLRPGDRIIEVNGKVVTNRDDVVDAIHPSIGKPVRLKVERDGKELVLTGTPQPRSATAKFLTVVEAPKGTDLALQPGDQVERINGKSLDDLAKPSETTGEEVVNRVLLEQTGKPVTVMVWRGGTQRMEVSGRAAPLALALREGKRTFGALGFQPIPGAGPRVGFQESVVQGFSRLLATLMGFYGLFSQPKQLGESVGGPLAIWFIVGEAIGLPGWYYFGMLGSLSVSLAVFNLLPVPILDGGHMLLLTFEVLRRRRLEPEMQRFAMMVGLAIIGVVFVLILGKDLLKHVL